MKRDLIWGWVFVILAIVMLCFALYGFYIGNDFGAMMCCIAAGIDIGNAMLHFTEYKFQRDWNDSLAKLNEALKASWPDEEDDESEEDNRITE